MTFDHHVQGIVDHRRDAVRRGQAASRKRPRPPHTITASICHYQPNIPDPSLLSIVRQQIDFQMLFSHLPVHVANVRPPRVFFERICSP